MRNRTLDLRSLRSDTISLCYRVFTESLLTTGFINNERPAILVMSFTPTISGTKVLLEAID